MTPFFWARFTAIFALLWLLTPDARSQVDPESIIIARDSFGVPHIFAQTDAEVAYGFAWATAEDDFRSVQLQLLAMRGRQGEVEGKAGAIADLAVQLLEIRETVSLKYEIDLSPEFRAVVESYCDGINAYAKAYPDQVLIEDIFPVNGKDLVGGYVLGLGLLSNIDGALGKLLNGKVADDPVSVIKGSNGIAVSRDRTADGFTYLAINSHQPLEGPLAWYEAHISSAEGWNMVGACFAGGASLFVGTNEHLGWTHTVNKPDFADIYLLEMHPEKKRTYRFDGAWYQLEKRKATTKVKVGPGKVPYSLTYYRSIHGPVFKVDHQYYALRAPAMYEIKGAEQWFQMNKADSWESFRQALDIQGLPCFNVVYADMEDHIYYLSNGLFPYRNPGYDWSATVSGDTSATLWKAEYYPVDSLAQVLDPTSGYVFNTNNTPMNATGLGDNLKLGQLIPTMGYEQYDNNRSLRFQELMEDQGEIDWETFKRIKYDLSYHYPLYVPTMTNLEELFKLKPRDFPDHASLLQELYVWDRKTDIQSTGATVFILTLHYLYELMKKEGRNVTGNRLSKAEMLWAVKKAGKHMIKHFGTTAVPLGQFQRHIRGDKSLPMPGGPDILAAMYSKPYQKGAFKTFAGESYIQLVRFTPDGPIIESVNAYGASADPESPHYDDQMELFTQGRTKPMTLDQEAVLNQALKVYHPHKLHIPTLDGGNSANR
ncbi:penicillin acylase family protein [Pontibacter sp. G13]|uniref:penicillin acylase family protein n=1 Tax=Pontibacter sp. G13 TaxID=3074898 RepID=UPI00288C09FD|nr:penicillin acylase family protein [Pontibacter sp. G13]WNJ19147.1 penicillin acylase family protein [Pontibacter sp. G13]